MSHLALFRKYRPKLFHEIVGQEFIVRTLTNEIKLNKVSHAYIFAGPKGIGKTTIAKIFAKAVNCLHPIDGDACNQCTNCKIINENQTTDILELDAASNNGVDEVRTIIDGIRFLPTSLNKKVYIIDEAHMLTTQAWNAMLKTVEEAPSHVIFIFATTEMHKIPATILSRSQHFLFSRLTNDQLTHMIEDIATKEEITIDRDAINKIITLADGSARDTLSILEQMAMYTNNQITLKNVIEVFGLVDIDNKIKLVNLILNKDTQAIMTLLDEYAQNGINFAQLANDLTVLLIDKLIYLQTQNLSILKTLSQANINLIQVNEAQCISLINVWQETFMKMRYANDTRFYFELGVFNCFKLLDTPSKTTIAKPIVNKTPSSVANTEVIKEVTKVMPHVEKPRKQEFDETAELAALPPIEEIFTVSNYEEPAEPKNQTKSLTPGNIPSSSIEELFNQIAFNHNKESVEQAKKFLDYVKSDHKNKNLAFIMPADKVLIASKNGMVLLFDDQVDAEILNVKNTNENFLEDVNTFFKHPIFILGFDREKSKELGQKFMIMRKQGQSFDEPDITSLKDIIKSNNSIEQFARELWGDNND
jgi:DNA polymerase-3 subunit gamma/tau